MKRSRYLVSLGRGGGGSRSGSRAVKQSSAASQRVKVREPGSMSLRNTLRRCWFRRTRRIDNGQGHIRPNIRPSPVLPIGGSSCTFGRRSQWPRVHVWGGAHPRLATRERRGCQARASRAILEGIAQRLRGRRIEVFPDAHTAFPAAWLARRVRRAAQDEPCSWLACRGNGDFLSRRGPIDELRPCRLRVVEVNDSPRHGFLRLVRRDQPCGCGRLRSSGAGWRVLYALDLAEEVPGARGIPEAKMGLGQLGQHRCGLCGLPLRSF